MKTKSNRISFAFLFIVFSAALILSGCGSKSDPAPAQTAQEKVTATLTGGTWKINSVTVDGADKTSMYTNMNLTFTSTQYAALNGGAVWPSSGTWTFTSTDATAIQRNDGLVVTLQEATSTSLKLGLTWTKSTLGPGRVGSIAGQHVFSFSK
jgi:hypothetical protein